MSELREAAQAALEQWDKASDVYSMTSAVDRLRAVLAQPKTELRDQHKAFAEWFLQQNPIAPNVEDLAWAAWKAALAQPEAAQPVAWAVMCDGSAVQTFLTETAANLIADNLREQNRGRDFDWQTTPLYAHPPRDEWRPASEPPEDLRGRVIAWRHPPQRQGGAWIEALYDDGAWVTRDGIAHDITHWRDVTPPTTEGE